MWLKFSFGFGRRKGKHHKHRHHLKPVTNAKVSFMSKTAVVTWKDPTADPANLVTGVEVSMRVQVASGTPPPWAVLDTIPVGVQTASVPDLTAGGYDFRLVTVSPTARGADEVIVSGSFSETLPPPVEVLAPVTGAAVSFS